MRSRAGTVRREALNLAISLKDDIMKSIVDELIVADDSVGAGTIDAG